MIALALLLVTAPPSLEHAERLHGPAMVTVHVVDGPSRNGFFVAGSGIVVTVVPDVEQVIVELLSGERRTARVLVRDDDGLALLEVHKLDKDGVFASLGLGSGAPPSSTAWVMGLGVVDGRASPSVGGLRGMDGPGRWRLDLPLNPGAPLMGSERVIGVVVERKGTTSCVAVPIERVQSLVKRMP